jgi:hypothetical protein
MSSESSALVEMIGKQKNIVIRGLKQPLVLDEIWQPVEYGWFARWKEYVNFNVNGVDHRSDEVRVRVRDRDRVNFDDNGVGNRSDEG